MLPPRWTSSSVGAFRLVATFFVQVLFLTLLPDSQHLCFPTSSYVRSLTLCESVHRLSLPIRNARPRHGSRSGSGFTPARHSSQHARKHCEEGQANEACRQAVSSACSVLLVSHPSHREEAPGRIIFHIACVALQFLSVVPLTW